MTNNSDQLDVRNKASGRMWSPETSRHIRKRVVVTGTLVLLTPTHFGNGDASGATDMPLLRDARSNKPLLTGASIAGALRAYLRDCGLQRADEALFGAIKTDDEGLQSALIVDDALGENQAIEMRDGVMLDAGSRTAADDKLFNLETWQAGTRFKLRFELLVSARKRVPKKNEWQAYSDSEMLAHEQTLKQALATALAGLSNDSITLGARKQRGYGQVSVSNWQVQEFDLRQNAGLLAWLAYDLSADEQKKLRLVPPPTALSADLAALGEPSTNQRHEFTIAAQFWLDGSVMIRGGSGSDDQGPDSVHLTSHRIDKKDNRSETPILSGTSIAGALRGRAYKIANTLTPNNKTARQLVEQIFGPDMSHKRDPFASKLRVDECEINKAQTDWVQTRIRIDRFTGGTIDGALFTEQPVFGIGEGETGTTLSLKLRLRNPCDAEIGLLLLLLKDLWTGDLPLGGQISIGRGRLRGISAALTRCGADREKQTWTITAHGKPRSPDIRITAGDAQTLEEFVSKALQTKLAA